ncbi:aconitase/3-isopropylmalate dehydratase large subunit family protein [Desulfovibrio aminophilus]|uniref:3-isopropylmalate dehydratase large subunit n=1 Tax=Desulfovibrio aminophilus TaxID=81425 RepID=UPI0033976543
MMNAVEACLAKASGQKTVRLGQEIRCRVGLVAAHDVTAPMAIARFREIGVDRVFDPKGVVLVMDHILPAATVNARTGQWMLKDFAAEFGVTLYERSQGVIHQLLAERHRLEPGGILIGADSHTGTSGGYGVIGIGVGSTEAAAAMATGAIDLEVPPTVRVVLTGSLRGNVSGKDVVLHLLRLFGTDGLTDKALYLTGPAAAAMRLEDRLTVCNMGIEMGAFFSLFDLSPGGSDGEAGQFADTLTLRLDDLEPLAACPSSPGNIRPVRELSDVALTQVVVGSCTNGRLSDMEQVVRVLDGRQVARGVTLIVVPASDRVLEGMEARGWTKLLRASGAMITNPGCGPCFGAHQGLASKRDVVASTTNRNFPGRMGHREAAIYLVSPATAAASALTGRLTVAQA